MKKTKFLKHVIAEGQISNTKTRHTPEKKSVLTIMMMMMMMMMMMIKE